VTFLSETIATLQIRTITHTLIGGYNASPYSIQLNLPEFPRAQEFKGLWRWWFRALIGGVLWESGLRGNELKERTIKTSMDVLGSLKSVSKLILNVNLDFEGWKSRFKKIKNIPTEKVSFSKVIPSCENKKCASFSFSPIPPRLFLLQMGLSQEVAGSRISCFEPGTSLSLTLKRRPRRTLSSISKLEEKVALEALCLSLIFGGIGAITRRGFGATHIDAINDCDYEDIKGPVEKIFKEGDEETLRNFIDQVMKDTRGLLQVGSSEALQELPDFPILSSQNKIFRWTLWKLKLEEDREVDGILQRMGYEDIEAMRLLAWLGYSTVKAAWKINNNKRPTDPDFNFHTWILGLPREVGGTGYKPVDEKYNRRVSSISLKPLRRMDNGSWDIMVYGFVSRDWPEIEHFSYPNIPKTINIDEKMINQALEQAWNMILELLGGES
jgi:CRISPR type III-B/RAMP module RAMP protein Cmr1